MQELNAIREAVIGGLHREIEACIGEATAVGVPPAAVMNDGLIAAMDEIGRRFGAGEIFVPEMLVAALTMKKGLDSLKPLLAAGGAAPAGTILMATVKGDLHDIGKNIVAMMLEGAGFRVVDLGVDVDTEKVIRGIEAENPDILGFSSLLTTTMPEMGAIIAALAARGLRDRVRIMVGGAPLDAAYAERIGADGYGRDAVAAVEMARRFMDR
ncbi:MAG: cobalamin-dependent protein [Syntrophales bacterium]|nr:cobalamin-dependent protein [Syntrophales bacterium]